MAVFLRYKLHTFRVPEKLVSNPFLLIYGSGWDWKRVFRVLGKYEAYNARKRPFCNSNYLRLLAIVLGPKNSTNNSWWLINTIDFGMVSERVNFPQEPLGFWGFGVVSIRLVREQCIDCYAACFRKRVVWSKRVLLTGACRGKGSTLFLSFH